MSNLSKTCKKCGRPKKEVFPRYIRRGGKMIFPTHSECFHFWVCDCSRKK